MGFKPPLSRGIIKKFFLISSWFLLRRSQSKIQNPKSKIEMTIFEAVFYLDKGTCRKSPDKWSSDG
jgi:hypothetical protein